MRTVDEDLSILRIIVYFETMETEHQTIKLGAAAKDLRYPSLIFSQLVIHSIGGARIRSTIAKGTLADRMMPLLFAIKFTTHQSHELLSGCLDGRPNTQSIASRRSLYSHPNLLILIARRTWSLHRLMLLLLLLLLVSNLERLLIIVSHHHALLLLFFLGESHGLRERIFGLLAIVVPIIVSRVHTKLERRGALALLVLLLLVVDSRNIRIW